LVLRGSEGHLEVMILGVSAHVAGAFWGVDNVQEDCSNLLWVGCLWRADVASLGEEAELKKFKFRAFTGDGTKHGRTFSQSKVSCSHAAVEIYEVVNSRPAWRRGSRS
jgi:hypothetical protein